MQLDVRVLIADPLMKNIRKFNSGGKRFLSRGPFLCNICEELSENEVDL
jgi:hypothetical protein